MQWLPGHKLKNRPYEIEKELGEGGFGITYKARNLTLDIPVVIKTPNRKLQRDGNYQKYVENFTREAKQLAKLGLNPHPHIVRVTDLFEEDKLPCIIMDFIPGQSLYDLVWTQGKLSETKAVEYIKQIGSALSVCHKAGIVHRDVHPNNILIHADNGKAVLIDFGISGTTQTSRNTHSGNRAFAPWEQVAYWEEENSKTPQVDIYTLAVSLYYLVTGQEPTECLARKYNNSELIEPNQLNSDLSDGINQAILKGVEVLAENRPSSMEELLNLLCVSSAASYEKPLNSQPFVVTGNTEKRVQEVLKERNYVEDNRQAAKNSDKKLPHTQPVQEQQNSEAKTLVETEKINNVSHNKSTSADEIQSVGKTDVKLKNSQTKQNNNLVQFLAAGFFIVFLILFPSIKNQFFQTETNKQSAQDKQISETQIKQKPDILEISKPELMSTLAGHGADVDSVAFSPDGQTIASGGYDDTMKLWDVSTNELTAILIGHGTTVFSVAFSPDGQTLVVGSDSFDIELWKISPNVE